MRGARRYKAEPFRQDPGARVIDHPGAGWSPEDADDAVAALVARLMPPL